MSNTEIRDSLTAAIRELNKVEVKGKQNLTSLLGTINYLSNLADNLAEQDAANEGEHQ